MNHLSIDDLAQLDGGIGNRLSEQRAHVEACSACAGRLVAVAGIPALLAPLADAPMPPAVAARLEAALALAPSQQREVRRWQRPALIASGSAAAVIAVVAALSSLDSFNSTNGGATSSSTRNEASGPAATSGKASLMALDAGDLGAQARALLAGGGVNDPAGAARVPKPLAASARVSKQYAAEPLDGCLRGLGASLATGTGVFAGAPARLVVLRRPGDSAHVDVVVLPLRCPVGPGDVLRRVDGVPR